MGARTLIFVRHGQYANDPERLTDLGRAQAALVGARLAQLRVDALWTSRLPRAIETADILARALPEGLPRKALRDLNECIPGRARVHRPWADRLTDENFAFGESRRDRAWAKLGKPTRGADRVEVVVGHGNVIRAVLLHAMGLDTRAWPELTILQGSLTTIRVDKEMTKLAGYNDVGHLPPAMHTEM